jgi:hypothetical protein
MPTIGSTEVVIGLTAVFLLIYDAYALFKDGNTTISSVLKNLAFRRPIIPLLAGLIIGHLFWTNC